MILDFNFNFGKIPPMLTDVNERSEDEIRNPKPSCNGYCPCHAFGEDALHEPGEECPHCGCVPKGFAMQ